ncbi:hypothetical protein DFH06DRAFT_428621 [Mycena polygramma]|nr:hypothetical protein DFH06DRAFT_428621 [Mycena polygramma]
MFASSGDARPPPPDIGSDEELDLDATFPGKSLPPQPFNPSTSTATLKRTRSSTSSKPISPKPPTGLNRSKRCWFWSDDELEGEEWITPDEPDYKRPRKSSPSPSSPGSLDVPPHLPRSRDSFLDFCNRPGPIFVDKTQCILDLPVKFQFLLLRPPRFGKTAFLSTLYHYYDIQGTTQYIDRFGSLAVVSKASDSASQHNHHLCLSFDLSEISVYSDMEAIASQVIDDVLNTFLVKYTTELQISELQDFDDESLENKFSKDRVQECHHTLFVSVDNYDAPTRSHSFPHDDFFEVFGTARDIEDLLDSCFWAPLMAGSHVIDKLLVTGSLYVKHPDLEQLDCIPSLQSACGFTEQEALHFTQSFFDETPDMANLRRLCGEYTFASRDTERGMPVLHPQLVINWIRELSGSLPHLHVDTDLFRLLVDLIPLLPEKSDNLGAITVNDLIQLLATGAVEVSMDTNSTFDANKTITWGTLYYAGALTFAHQSTGTLRVANSAALSAIHSRVDTEFADRHQLQWEFGSAWVAFSGRGGPKLLLELLTEVLRDLAQRSLGKKREPDLRGVFELVMRNSHCSTPSRPVDPIILLPADVACVQIPARQPDATVTVELKTLTLRGMWQATNLNDGEPPAEALETLHRELVELDEESLLARPYRAWSATLDATETKLLGSFLDSNSQNPQLLAVGGARVLTYRKEPYRRPCCKHCKRPYN